MRKSAPVASIKASAWGRALGHGRRCGDQPVRKVLTLIRVEHGEPLEERDGARLVAVAFGPPAFLLLRRIADLRDGRREPLSRRQTPACLSLGGVAGGLPAEGVGRDAERLVRRGRLSPPR
jgi:hypothetical protein